MVTTPLLLPETAQPQLETYLKMLRIQLPPSRFKTMPGRQIYLTLTPSTPGSELVRHLQATPWTWVATLTPPGFSELVGHKLLPVICRTALTWPKLMPTTHL